MGQGYSKHSVLVPIRMWKRVDEFVGDEGPTGIVSVAKYRPVDRFGLLEPLSNLRTRYEDEPDSRAATAAEITAVLDDFRLRAPWPTTT